MKQNLLNHSQAQIKNDTFHENIPSLRRIGILMGGYSSEREISLKSGNAVYDALKQHGCDVVKIDIHSQDEEGISSLIKKACMDVAFIALHGRLGEDGKIQAILENLNIPYPGTRVEASRLALNKVSAQRLFKQNGIPIARYAVVSKKNKTDITAVLNELKTFPLVVKPASEGSSIGISIVMEENDFVTALRKAFEYDEEALVECYIKGRELTVGILDEEALPVIEIRPKKIFFDFESKYQSGMSEYIVPARLSDDIALEVQRTALKAHHVLGCRDFSRVDIILDKHNDLFVLEVNTIPGFTATSLLPKAAKANGLDFTQLCLRLVGLAYAKQK